MALETSEKTSRAGFTRSYKKHDQPKCVGSHISKKMLFC
jgi:hypothetical protein